MKSEEQGFAKSAEFFIQARKKKLFCRFQNNFSEDLSFPFRLLLLHHHHLPRDP